DQGRARPSRAGAEGDLGARRGEPVPDRRRSSGGTALRLVRAAGRAARRAGRPGGVRRRRRRAREGGRAHLDGRRARAGSGRAGSGGAAALRRGDARSPEEGMTALVARDQRYYDPVVQTMPLERVRALQAERLARQLDRVWTTPVPFFKRKFEAAGLKRADV